MERKKDVTEEAINSELSSDMIISDKEIRYKSANLNKEFRVSTIKPISLFPPTLGLRDKDLNDEKFQLDKGHNGV